MTAGAGFMTRLNRAGFLAAPGTAGVAAPGLATTGAIGVAAPGLTALAALAALTGCGAGGADPPPDANPGGCFMQITGYVPAMPQAGASITVSGLATGGAGGFETLAWRVTTGDVVIVDTAADGSGTDSVEFPAATAGVYEVTLNGERGGVSCLGDALSFTVTAPDASAETYLLRAVPGPGTGAATRHQEITVYGGADSHVGVVALSGASVLAAQVTDDTGAGLPAYVRARSVFGHETEGLTDASGGVELPLEPGAYDVLVIPDALAPHRFTAVTVPGSDTHFALDAGEPIAGTVRDGAGQAIAGARVILRLDGVPTTVATTDAAGAFEVRGRPAGAQALSVAVAPPESTGLPTLSVAPDSALAAAAGSLDIRYAATLATRSVTVPLRDADGATPAPAGTRVTWIAPVVAAAGTVTRGATSATATGTVRRSAVAGPGGAPPAVALTDARYDVIVEPAAGPGTALHAVDLSAGSPAPEFVALHHPATVAGTAVHGPDAAPVAAVRITATPTGPLAAATSAVRTAVSGPDGQFQLDLPPGASYQLTAISRHADHARAVAGVQTPGPGQPLDLGPLALPAAVAVSGEVTITWPMQSPLPVAGVHVVVLCAGCPGADATRTVAEAVTGDDGRFILRVPDPELQTQAHGM